MINSIPQPAVWSSFSGVLLLIAGALLATVAFAIRFTLDDVELGAAALGFSTVGIQMEAHSIIVWLIIGALAGWLAGKLVKGGGFGLIGDIVVGIVGAFIGGWLAGVLGVSIGSGFVASVITAIIGAVILLVILRAIRRA